MTSHLSWAAGISVGCLCTLFVYMILPDLLTGGSGLQLTPHVNKPHYARAYQTSAYIMFSNVPLVKARQVVNLTVTVAGICTEHEYWET